MRRALQLCDITDRAGRDRLDQLRSERLPPGTIVDGGIEVSGARNDDGVLALTIRTDGVNSAELFRSILLHGNEECAPHPSALDAEVPPARSTPLTGGWAGMSCVRDVEPPFSRASPSPPERRTPPTVQHFSLPGCSHPHHTNRRRPP